jgi:hypothetical protein
MSDVVARLGGESHRVERAFREDSGTEEFNVREFAELRRATGHDSSGAATGEEVLESIRPGMFVYGLIEELQGVPYAGCRLRLESLPVFYVLEFVERVSQRRLRDAADAAARSLSENAEVLVLRCKRMEELTGGRLATKEQLNSSDLVLSDQPFYMPIDSIVGQMHAILGPGAPTLAYDAPRRVSHYASLVTEEFKFERGGCIRPLLHSSDVLRSPFDDVAQRFFVGLRDDDDGPTADDDDDDDDDAEFKMPRGQRPRAASMHPFTRRKRSTTGSDNDEDKSVLKRAAKGRYPGYKSSTFGSTGGNPRGRPWWKDRGQEPPPSARTMRRELGVNGADDPLRNLAQVGDAVRTALKSAPADSPKPTPAASAAAATTAVKVSATPTVKVAPTTPSAAAAAAPPPPAQTQPRPPATHAQQQVEPPRASSVAPPVAIVAEPSSAVVNETCTFPADQVDLSDASWKRFKPQLVKHIVAALEAPGRDESMFRASARVRTVFCDLTRTRLGGEFGAFIDATLHANPQLTARFLARFTEPYIRVAHHFVVRPIAYRELCHLSIIDGVEPIGNDILALALSMR